MARRKQTTLWPEALTRKSALLAIAHLEVAADHLDACCGEEPRMHPLPSLAGKDLGSEALALAVQIRHALAALELAEQP